MTFAEVQAKIIKRWWIILILAIGATFLAFPWAKSTTYQASIGIGIQFNNPKFIALNSNDLATAYIASITEFSTYLEARFTSIEVQDFIVSKAGLPAKSLNEKTPFYKISKGAGGFLSVSYTDDRKENAEKFISAVEGAYNQVISEWNDSRLEEFQIKPMANFTKTISPTEKPPQIQVLPTILGWLFGIVVAVVLPSKNKV